MIFINISRETEEKREPLGEMEMVRPGESSWDGWGGAGDQYMAGRTPRGEVERWRCGEGWEQGWETQTQGDGGANTDAHREYQVHGAELAPGIHGRTSEGP